MMPAEFLLLGLFFVLLDVTAHKRSTSLGFLCTLRVWAGVQGVLFRIFTVLVYTMEKGFMTPLLPPYPVRYLPSALHSFVQARPLHYNPGRPSLARTLVL